MCLLVEVADGRQAKVRETVTDFCEVLLAQHLCFSVVGPPSHAGGFYYFRLIFAHASRAVFSRRISGIQLGIQHPRFSCVWSCYNAWAWLDMATERH